VIGGKVNDDPFVFSAEPFNPLGLLLYPALNRATFFVLYRPGLAVFSRIMSHIKIAWEGE